MEGGNPPSPDVSIHSWGMLGFGDKLIISRLQQDRAEILPGQVSGFHRQFLLQRFPTPDSVGLHVNVLRGGWCSGLFLHPGVTCWKSGRGGLTWEALPVELGSRPRLLIGSCNGPSQAPALIRQEASLLTSLPGLQAESAFPSYLVAPVCPRESRRVDSLEEERGSAWHGRCPESKLRRPVWARRPVGGWDFGATFRHRIPQPGKMGLRGRLSASLAMSHSKSPWPPGPETSDQERCSLSP